MSEYNGSFHVGNHVWIAKIGGEITTDVYVDANNKPGITPEDGLSLWLKLGSVISVTPSVEETRIDNTRPDPYVLRTFDSRVIQEKYTYAIELGSLDKVIFEILFKTTLKEDGTFKQRSTSVQRGWVKWQGVSYNDTPLVIDEFCDFSVTGPAFNGTDFVKPTLNLTVLESPLSTGKFSPVSY